MFDVRYGQYTHVRSGTPVSTSGTALSSMSSGIINLNNPNINTYFAERFNLVYTSIAAGTANNRYAIGYRLNSDFEGFTQSPDNSAPMAWDVMMNIRATIIVDNADVNSCNGNFGLSAWLLTGTHNTGGNGNIAGQQPIVLHEGSTQIAGEEGVGTHLIANSWLNYRETVVIHPDYLANDPLPLAIGVAVCFPDNVAVEIFDFNGTVSVAPYIGVQDVYAPRRN